MGPLATAGSKQPRPIKTAVTVESVKVGGYADS